MATANKTRPTAGSAKAFLAEVEPERRRLEGQRLDALFRKVTGYEPVLWGPTIVGYGKYHYKYASGREGDYLATGFSPRKAKLVVYILPGYEDFGDLLADLGKHQLGKSCLYLNSLDDVDEAVLGRLIRAGLSSLRKQAKVLAT